MYKTFLGGSKNNYLTTGKNVALEFFSLVEKNEEKLIGNPLKIFFPTL